MNEYIATSNVSVYPNPNNGFITLEVNNVGENNTVVITNTIGQVVYKTILTNTKTIIDLSHQPNGIYFVNIGNITKKIIKE